MINIKPAREVRNQLEASGFKGRIVSIRHLSELYAEIENLRHNGKFAEIVYNEHISYFSRNNSGVSPEVKSMVITAAAQPQQRVGFRFRGNRNAFIIPPTYSYETDYIIEKLLTDITKSLGFQFFQAKLPQKLLASRSGMVKYGRNNIVYAEGMGSYLRLKTYFSDMPAEDDSWYEMEMLDQCSNCNACIKKCPTKAISSEEFIIKQDRCLTFHNERENNFPEWIENSWHNCLMGCMYCQKVCPANLEIKDWVVDAVEFNEEETGAILRKTQDELNHTARNKLEKIDMLDDLSIFRRNLGILLKQRL